VLESFIIKGHWKLPDDAKTYSGTLEYDPSKGGSLKLIGMFKVFKDLNKIDKRDLIIGLTIDGKKSPYVIA
jgi:hypothetical protein